MKRAAMTLLLIVVAACSSGDSPGAVTTTTAPTTASAAATRIPTQAENDPEHYETLTLATPTDAMSCVEATRSSKPDDLIAAFRAARLAGHGAEACVDDQALARYTSPCDDTGLASDPGPVVLYGCGTHRIVDIPNREVTAPKGDHTYVHLSIYFDGSPGPQDEYVNVTPGVPAGSRSPARQVITSPAAI